MNSMRQMQNQMMSNMLDPFRMFSMPGIGGFGGLGLGSRSQLMQSSPSMHHSSPSMHHSSPSMHISPMHNSLMPMNLNRLLSAPQNGVSFSSSSCYSVMSSGSDGRPQVYHETSSTKVGPGGLKETRRTVQDSASGKKKMAIGHHLGEKAHVVEKEQNMHTGEREEREDFINLDEEESEEFERKFEHKSRQLQGGRQRCQIEEISSQPLLAIQS